MNKGNFTTYTDAMPMTSDAKLNELISEYVEMGFEDPHEYTSRPGDGTVRYVFHNKVCLGAPAAREYVATLIAHARQG